MVVNIVGAHYRVADRVEHSSAAQAVVRGALPVLLGAVAYPPAERVLGQFYDPIAKPRFDEFG